MGLARSVLRPSEVSSEKSGGASIALRLAGDWMERGDDVLGGGGCDPPPAWVVPRGGSPLRIATSDAARLRAFVDAGQK